MNHHILSLNSVHVAFGDGAAEKNDLSQPEGILVLLSLDTLAHFYLKRQRVHGIRRSRL